LLILFALGGLLGCQGVSSAASNQNPGGGLAVTTTHLDFGTVVVGASKPLMDTVTNSTSASVTISQATVTGSGFQIVGPNFPLTLPAGQSASLSLTFAPKMAGSPAGNVVLMSDAPNPATTVALSGTAVPAGQLAANPPSISFGTVQVGSSSSLSDTLTNSGGSSVTISQVTVTGSVFSKSGINPPLTLTPGQSFTFTATFTPTVAGAVSGSIAIVSDGSNPNLTVALAGTGTAAGQLVVAPATLNFGNVTVGTSASLTGTLSATGASVTVSSASVNSSEFSISGLTLPITIVAGQSKAFTATFTPQASGAASANASFMSNATNSPTTETLAGSGTPAPQHSVDLSWSETGTGVVGYNVYRGAKSGGPYTRINTALDAATAYTDGLVTAGQTYYYVTTAVDGGSNESTYSNEVQAVIPTP
jgi:HYDIN/CFA65/VesB family protein/ASPM-SPD-2-Hydin domain-containing protein/centrosomal CEP192-like protein